MLTKTYQIDLSAVNMLYCHECVAISVYYLVKRRYAFGILFFTIFSAHWIDYKMKILKNPNGLIVYTETPS